MPPERAGSAAALNETSGEFGYALGIAALGSVGTAVYRSGVGSDIAAAGLSGAQAKTAHDTLAGALSTATSLPASVGDAITAAARSAFVDGMHAAATISAIVLAALSVLVITTLRRVPATADAHAAPDEAALESSPRQRTLTDVDA